MVGPGRDADKSSIWPSWSSVWGKASCKSMEPSWAEELLMVICVCCGYRLVETCTSCHTENPVLRCHPPFYLQEPSSKPFMSRGGFAGGSEGERVPEGAVYWAHRLCCPGKSRGRAQTGGSRGRDTPTDWQPEGDLWETRRGDEETGREGLCFLPNVQCCEQAKHKVTWKE